MVDIFGIHFAGAHRIIFLPLFLFFIYLVIRQYINLKRHVGLLVHPRNQQTVLKNFSLRRQFLKTVFMVCSITLIFLSLLQPQWGKKEITTRQEGRDLLIALDISRSMLAKDLTPNRLDFTKLKIRNLLQRLDFERVGLILFSGSAFLQCPLTADHAAFLMFLDQVDVESIASGTTSMSNALLKAIEVFSTSDRKNKLVVTLF